MKKIVIKVEMHCDKCRTKALKIAAMVQGVKSVSLEGERRDQVVVTGDVDSVCLANQLRKKFRCATIVSVEDVDSGATKKPGNKKTTPTKKESASCSCHSWQCPPACPPYCQVTYDIDPNPNSCFVM